MKKNVCVFLFDGFSAWEIVCIGSEIKQSETADIRYFTKDVSQVTSGGGLSIKADGAVSEVDAKNFSALVLPGGDAWENGEIKGLEGLVREFVAGKTVTAICSATAFPGQHGYLERIKHKSNSLPYLKQFAPA